MAVSGPEAMTPAWRSAWLPITLGIAAVGVLAGAFMLSQRVGGEGAPPPPPAFVAPQGSTVTVRDVKQRTGDVLTVIAGDGVELALTVPRGATVERLQEALARDIRVGDTVTVVGIPNEVLSFSIHFVVVMASPIGSEEGTARSEGGFAGHEASPDPRDRPIVGGIVESVSDGGDRVVFKGPDGSATLRLNEAVAARVYRVERVDPAAIREGDRLAADFSGPVVQSLLAMPPGN